MIPALLGLGLGIVLRLAPGDRATWMAPLTRSLIYVFYPTLIFSSILASYEKETILAGLYLPFASFVIMLVGFGFGALWARGRPQDSAPQRGTLRFACTMNNYVFLPLLIVEPLWGSAGTAAVVLAALGGDIAVWGFGVSCFPNSGGRLTRLLNPPIVTLVASILIVMSGSAPWFQGSVDLVSWLSWPAKLALPVAMLVLGFYLAGVSVAQLKTGLVWQVAAYRLVLMPALTVLVLSMVSLPSHIEGVILLISAMPVAMATVFLGEAFGGDGERAAGLVLLSHLVAIVTTPAWLLLLGYQ